MGLTINEILINLESLQKDYQDFYDEVWQDPEYYGIIAESLKSAINIMRKYQKIEQIYSDYLKYMNPSSFADKIREVLEDGNNT